MDEAVSYQFNVQIPVTEPKRVQGKRFLPDKGFETGRGSAMGMLVVFSNLLSGRGMKQGTEVAVSGSLSQVTGWNS